MPRFVLLEHDHPHRHWDLMFEAGDVLWTWRLAWPPVPAGRTPAVRLGDHRLVYLDYEGPVSGGRGTVQREDFGTYTWLEQTEGDRCARIVGERLRGRLRLRQVAGEEWEAEYEPEG